MVDQSLKELLLAVEGKVDHVAELISKMRNREHPQRLRGEEVDRRLVPGGVKGATEVLVIGPSKLLCTCSIHSVSTVDHHHVSPTKCSCIGRPVTS